MPAALAFALLALVAACSGASPGPGRFPAGFNSSDRAASLVYLDNGVVRVGIDLSRGGSIAYMSTSAGASEASNVINAHDMGREVQLSFYSGPAFYNPEGKCDKLFNGQEWPWNPIGGMY